MKEEQEVLPGTMVWTAPFYNRSGYGVSARSFVSSLHKAGLRIRILPVNEVDPGIDDCDLALFKSLETTPLVPPVTLIISHVPSKDWLSLKLPEPNLRIMATTFDSSAQGNLPPAEWMPVLQEMDQVWLTTEEERKVFLSAGVPPEKIQVVYWPHPWLDNPCIPSPGPEVLDPPNRFRFLSIAMFLPRRRWDTLIEAYLEEFKGNEGVELYLKVNYPSWHPVPGKPRQDLHDLVASLRQETGSQAPIIIDENLGTRTGIVRLMDSCNVYISTDTSRTAPVVEAWVRQRLVVIPEGLGHGIHPDHYIRIPVDPNARGPVTQDMLLYQPHHKGAFMPLLSVGHVRDAMRRAYELPPEERRAMANGPSSCVFGPQNAASEAMRAINAGWQYKKSYSEKASSRKVQRIVWEGSQFVYHSLALINRELCLKLIDAGYDLSIIPYEKHSFGPEVDGRFHKLSARFNKKLEQGPHIHVRHQWPPNFNPPKEGRWVIIQPWEFGSLPKAWVEVMASKVDEMWVPSNYVRECYIKSGVPAERVFVVPNGVDALKFNPTAKPFLLKSKKRFKFLFVGGTIFRKGIDILLKAYTNTFNAKDDVCLVIKDMGGQSFYEGQTAGKLIAEIQERADAPEMEYLEQMMDESDMAGLYTACNCLLHPYRGEGFGFPIAEAMACGLPVIVTGYGAALDFCSVETAYLIPSKEVKFSKKMLGKEETVDYPWLAEPDEEALHDLLHHVIKNPEGAKAKGSLAREFISARFTWDRATEILKERVRELCTKPIIRFEREKRVEKYKKPMIHGMVSIIIPVTGETKHLKECVQAIRKRSPEPHEIIFLVTDSPQGIQKWLKRIPRENHNYKIIHTPKSLNPSESFNLGMGESSGEFLVFLNPDVVVTENWLSGLMECLQSAKDIGIVGPMTNQISGIQKVKKVPYQEIVDLDAFAKGFREGNRHRRVHCRRIVDFCMLFRRELVDRIGLLDESFGTGNFEDDDFCLRAELAGYRNMIAGDVFVHHFGIRSFAGNGIDPHSTLSANRKRFDDKWNGVDHKKPEGKKLLLLKAMESAREFCSREQIDKAIGKLLNALALEPQDPGLHCELAEIFLEAKGFEKAIEVLEQMPAGPQDERKMTLLGYSFDGLNKLEEAEEWAGRALSQNAHSAPALNLKGILAYRRQKMEEAAAFFQSSIETDKGYGEPYTNLGLMKWSAGQKEEAVSLFEKGFILAPTIPDQIMNYHAAVTETTQFARGEKYFREAKALHPFHKRIHFLLIDLLLRQGQHAEAMKEIEEAMISFGVDEGILTASLEVRKRIGAKEIPVGKNRNSLSLCMIVKNEEKHLPQCLGSIRDLVDEILIVDTGSGDKTREISTAFGAKVFEFPWEGDFSAARNFSLGQARGEWILILDADERIAAKDFPDLRRLACQKGNRRAAYSFVTRNYTTNPEVQGWTPNEGTYEEEKGIGWFPSEKVRLFPNDSRVCFQGVVHEGIRSSLVDHSVGIEDSSIPIHHFGKLDQQRERGKGEEYYLLGKKKLESSEADVRSLRELAVQAGELDRYEEAAELWNQVITLQPDMAEAYTNLSSLYLKLKKYDQAYAASKQAVTLDPDSKEALLNFSTAGLSRGKTFESIRTLESLLAKNPEYPPALGVLSVAYVLHGEKEKSSVLIEKLERWGFNYAEYLSLMSQEFASMGREKEGQMLHQMTAQGEALPSPVCKPGLPH